MRRAWLALLCVFAARAPVRAQSQLTGDIGVARLEQTGIPTSNALTGALTFDVSNERAWLRTSALAAFAGADRATAQGLVVGSVLGPLFNRARWELTGAVSGFGETNGPSSQSVDVFAGARVDEAWGGFAFGVGGGGVSLGSQWSGVARAQADTWWRRAGDQIAFSVSGVSIPSARVRIVVNGTQNVLADAGRASYTDASLTARHDQSAVSIAAIGGVRASLEGTGAGAWGSAEVAFWVSGRSALVVGGGRALDDVTRGIPRTNFVSVGLRFTSRARLAVPPPPTNDRAGVTVVAVGGGQQRIDVRGVDATRLEVMGDFTDWQPIEMRRSDGVWRAVVPIASGLHRIALRADGGEWSPPPGLPRTTDGLGGMLGLITIP